MTISKKLIIAVLMFASMPAAFGHYAGKLKKELIHIDNFTKELRQANSVESQKLVTYLDKVLKDDSGEWGTPEYRYISDDEVLAIDRILIADVSSEEKQAGVLKIMLEELEKAAKEREKTNKAKLREYFINGCAAGAAVIFIGIHLYDVFSRYNQNLISEIKYLCAFTAMDMYKFESDLSAISKLTEQEKNAARCVKLFSC